MNLQRIARGDAGGAASYKRCREIFDYGLMPCVGERHRVRTAPRSRHLPEDLFATVLPLIYPVYAVWLFCQWFAIWSFVLLVSWALYTLLSLVPLIAIAVVSKRTRDVHRLTVPALFMPFYRTLMRWVKIRALAMEVLRIRYEDSFLPETAWEHAPRF